jgi:hypothetical protein
MFPTLFNYNLCKYCAQFENVSPFTQDGPGTRRLFVSSNIVSHYHVHIRSAHSILLVQAYLSTPLQLDDKGHLDVPLAIYAANNWVSQVS